MQHRVQEVTNPKGTKAECNGERPLKSAVTGSKSVIIGTKNEQVVGRNISIGQDPDKELS